MIQLFMLSTIGVLLLWFGYTLFFRLPHEAGSQAIRSGRKDPFAAAPLIKDGVPGTPHTCPVCAAVLEKGERVKSAAFPTMGDNDRLMHILGCPFCIDAINPRDRSCPVCGMSLARDDYLIARLFDRPGRSHVHVLGCARCRGPRHGR